MGKQAGLKRLSSTSQSTSKSIDVKARKRIEELFELTDEIIHAYNEINDKYVNQIYRKYRRLQDINKRLQAKLKQRHCNGCKCTVEVNGNEEESSDVTTSSGSSSSDDGDDDNIDDEDYATRKSPRSLSVATNQMVTRSRKQNPFIISDIEDTQNFDTNDSRFHAKTVDNNDNHNTDDDDDDDDNNENDNTTMINTSQTNNNKSAAKNGHQETNNLVDESNDIDNEMLNLPVALRNVILRKAGKSKNTKTYLLHIPRYPALCEYLRDKSRASFDHRPTEIQVRQLITDHINPQTANNAKTRMRIRDELREIHRSYMRTFMVDPHSSGMKASLSKNRHLAVKKSPA